MQSPLLLQRPITFQPAGYEREESEGPERGRCPVSRVRGDLQGFGNRQHQKTRITLPSRSTLSAAQITTPDEAGEVAGLVRFRLICATV